MQGESHQPGGSNYLDFELEIGEGRGREYPVAVLRSPAGEPRATMRFPFDEVALDLHLSKLQIALLRSGGKQRRVPSEEERAVQDFGQALFNALVGGEVRSCYDMSLREAAQQDKGLRLKLRIRAPELNALPWEFMYDPRQAEYVCLSRQTPIIRYLESPHLIRALTVTPPLRILGMIASPKDLPALDVERERQRMERATSELRAQGLVELTWLPGQTWRDLQEAMWGGPWHIIHFIGHGGFDAHADEGFIALADSMGQTEPLSATRLARLLADHTALRLVLLNACEGARSSERDIFSSTASILVRRGIPAVLAMQYEITDRAAIELARAFYRALAYGMAVDEAVVVARKAISLAVANTVEWGTPVLYMRSPDGVLFHLAELPRVAPPAAQVPRRPPEVDAEQERRLEQLYLDGLAAFWVEDWDRACRCFQAIVDEHPDYQDVADKLTKAQRQKTWSALYEQAQAGRQAENWEAARSALEELVAERPDYKDAAALLEAMNRQVRLAGLYTEAQRLSQAQQWQAVVNVFARIAALDPHYPDPEGLLPSAQEEVAAQAGRAEVQDLYRRAVLAVDAGQWVEARELLTQVQTREPGYREADKLLARAEAEIGKDEAERQHQGRIAALYQAARRSATAGQWQEAQASLDEIYRLDPEFADPDGLSARAQAELRREEEEARRQRELAALYAEAVRLLRAEQYQAALDKWDEVKAHDPQYPDRNNVEVTARKKQAARAKPAGRRRLPRWAWAAIAGLALVVAVVVIVTVIVPAIIPAPPPQPGPTPDTLTAGSEWGWSDGSVMLYVPAEAFWMGSDESDADATHDEKPQHQVTMNAFWIDRTEVTNRQYRQCVADGPCSQPSNTKSYTRDSYYDNPDFDDYPVIYVDWEQANAYCAWAGKRLPTEAEWEKAARGTDRRIYPWGDVFDGSLLNFCDVNCELDWKAADWDDGYADTAPVGSYEAGASPCGALDMAGNVWEWTSSLYKLYPYDAKDGREDPAAGGTRVVRGGSWLLARGVVRAATRGPDYQPSYINYDVGLRCARSGAESLPPVETPMPTITPTPEPTITPVPISGPPQPGPTPTAPTASSEWAWSDGTVMLYVPAGAFWMGSTDQEIDAILAECSECERWTYISELTLHQVTVDTFWIDRTEVTNAQYRHCVADGPCSQPSNTELYTRGSYYDNPDFDDYPVVYVDWEQARAYCAWAGKRLPTEAEWEKAARGTDGWRFPWGDEFDEKKCNSWEGGAGDTTPVGRYSPGGDSPYGLADMAGNVEEWTGSLYKTYPYDARDGREDLEAAGSRAVRGGTWSGYQGFVRAAYRDDFNPSVAVSYLGFRCARSGAESPLLAETPVITPTPEPTITSMPEPTITPVPISGPPQPGPTPTALPAGSEWAWSDGTVMLYVPAGAFWMGSDESDPDAADEEKPQHQVTLDAFWIDRTEVTNGQYRRCVEDGPCSQPSKTKSYTRGSYYGNPDFDGYPVIYVNWEQAHAYCAWAGKRLPTEAEWEKTARGTDRWIYPWGDTFDGGLLNFCDANCEFDWKAADWDDGYADTAPVGSYERGAGPYGALDMAGNVWEWTSSLYGSYPYDSQDGREDPAAGGTRVLRGGSWDSTKRAVRAATRSIYVPYYVVNDLGFRCACSDSEP